MKNGELTPVLTIGNCLLFEYAKLSENRYLVVLPKLFKSETTNKFAIVTEKRFKVMMNINK